MLIKYIVTHKNFYVMHNNFSKPHIIILKLQHRLSVSHKDYNMTHSRFYGMQTINIEVQHDFDKTIIAQISA